MTMTHSSNRISSRRIGSSRRGRGWFFSSSRSGDGGNKNKNTSLRRAAKTFTAQLLLMSIFILILLSVALNLILYQAASASLSNNLIPVSLSAPTFTVTVTAKDRKSKTAVLVLFGVPKHFRLVWASYMKNIVQRNPQMKFEVYMHMYSDLHQKSFSNARNGERSTNLDSPDDVRAILNETEGIPTMLTTSSQSIFEKSELSWIQQSDTSFFTNYSFPTLLNVFRQGNSLGEAFFTLQKFKNNWNGNHVYIFARPDTFLMTPVDIPTSVGSFDVIVPSWHSWDGYNDRFAVAGPDAAKVYATKVEGYKEAILARRGWHIFEVLPSFRNSETLLKNWLLENKLNVTELKDDWAWALLRVRADGRIEPKDLDEFEIENASLVEDLRYRAVQETISSSL